MGEVYRARDTRLGRDVALKVLLGEVSADPDRRRRFEAEARSASALNHPNIVTVYDIGTSDSTIYVAMELVEGKMLRELILAEPLASPEAAGDRRSGRRRPGQGPRGGDRSPGPEA